MKDSMTVTHGVVPVRQTLSDRLRDVRSAAFVGRDDEIGLFGSALHRSDPAADLAVLYLWGVGGIGKSALLRRFGDEAELSGRRVIRVDAGVVGESPAELERAAAGALIPDRVLLVDNFDELGGVRTWFWDDFLPGLPADVLVVLAARQPPDPVRRLDPEWSAAVRVVCLEDLARPEAIRLLGRRGVPERLAGSLYEVAGGHPLALVLAADLAARDPESAASWRPQEPAVTLLLDRLIGDPPTPEHRRALDTCAHVLVTREDLLRSIFGDRAGELFGWLRGLPFIEAGPDGLHPRDLVRELLIADLRWRDPDGWRALYEQSRPYFLDRALTAAGPELLRAVKALAYPHRYSDTMARYVTWRANDEWYEDAYRDEDRGALLAMAGECGDRAVAAFWLDRQPQSFRVCRRAPTGEPAGFVCWLRLTGPDEEENAADPLIAAIWAHAEENGPLRPGGKLAVQRFARSGARVPEPGPVSDLILVRGMAVCLREPGLAWTYVCVPNPVVWGPVLEYAGHARLTGLPSVFAHDWAAAPVSTWLEGLRARLLHGAESRAVTLPSRAEFHQAVRELLRGWRHRPSVEGSPLLNTRLAGSGSPDERVERVRESVEEAVDALRGTPRGDDLHRTLAVTFFHAVPTQEAAAERLGIAFGTYRHRLAAALRHVADLLWQRATAAAVRSGIGTAAPITATDVPTAARRPS
jgi:hypothetical protein